MKFSFLIPAYNEADYVGLTLESIHKACREGRLTDYEIIVCDNASTDETAAVVEAHGGQVVVEADRCIAKARNRAAAISDGDLLVFIDADSTIDGQLVQRTLTLIGDGETCGGGARVRFIGHADLPLYVKTFFLTWDWFSQWFNYPAGSYLFCTREAWNACGGFDEGLYASEEIDLARRVKIWAKANGRRFTVIRDGFVKTSPRKLGWFGFKTMAGQMIRLAFNPKILRDRNKLNIWYERPDRTKESS